MKRRSLFPWCLADSARHDFRECEVLKVPLPCFWRLFGKDCGRLVFEKLVSQQSPSRVPQLHGCDLGMCVHTSSCSHVRNLLASPCSPRKPLLWVVLVVFRYTFSCLYLLDRQFLKDATSPGSVAFALFTMARLSDEKAGAFFFARLMRLSVLFLCRS